MEITFKGRRTSVPERFRRHASAKLAKLEKLDHNAIRVDVEVSTERNPRQADRSERVELTVRSRGPAIRAEAAAEGSAGSEASACPCAAPPPTRLSVLSAADVPRSGCGPARL